MKQLPLFTKEEWAANRGFFEPSSYSCWTRHTTLPEGRTTRALIGLIRWCHLTNQGGFYFTLTNYTAELFNKNVIPTICKQLDIEGHVEAMALSSILVGRCGVYSIDHLVYDYLKKYALTDARMYDLLSKYISEVKARFECI